jgi:hypothetical protein
MEVTRAVIALRGQPRKRRSSLATTIGRATAR